MPPPVQTQWGAYVGLRYFSVRTTRLRVPEAFALVNRSNPLALAYAPVPPVIFPFRDKAGEGETANFALMVPSESVMTSSHTPVMAPVARQRRVSWPAFFP